MAREVQAEQPKMTGRLNEILLELKNTSSEVSSTTGIGREQITESVDDNDDSESAGPLFRLPSVRSRCSTPNILSSKLGFVGPKREVEHNTIVIDDDI